MVDTAAQIFSQWDSSQNTSGVTAPVLANLWQGLEEARLSGPVGASEAAESFLATKRLGIASSLFFALRSRHAPTASHCLRVALSCSSWAIVRQADARFCDALEIAGLLHDVGKVGVPDYVLLKPGKLTADEQLIMSRYRLHTYEIVAACCASQDILEILQYQHAWFDGSRADQDRAGTAIPLGSRMLMILDAFDSMTTEHVYRKALTRERAIAELFQYAGTQFDPTLVEEFAGWVENGLLDVGGELARRWLRELHPDGISALLKPGFDRDTAPSLLPAVQGGVAREFHDCLLNSMHDGVIFVDANLRIIHWNRAAERLTGIQASTMLEQFFAPSLLVMRQVNGKTIPDENCPVAQALRDGVQTLQRVALVGRSGHAVLVNLHVVPVVDKFGERKGAAILLHDASAQVFLEERVNILQERATQDPLTKVANRAELERVYPEFIRAHLQRNSPCSVIMMDLDHFKKMNDVYGHQAGDEALKVFADVLRQVAAPDDFIARYGGEEFVMLCAGTDAAAAVERAEEVRRKLRTRGVPAMGGQCLTASFGVTQLQTGDTPETLLRRADRALLQAKSLGRNRVVQLGTGWVEEESVPERRSWWSRLLSGSSSQVRVSRNLITSVPLALAAEKLKGFISDHHAEILEVRGQCVHLRIDGPFTPLLRRHSDRAVAFDMRIEFFQDVVPNDSGATRPTTRIFVEVWPTRYRDRRSRDLQQRASQLLASLKAYLMAEDMERPVAADVPEGRHPVDLAALLR